MSLPFRMNDADRSGEGKRPACPASGRVTPRAVLAAAASLAVIGAGAGQARDRPAPSPMPAIAAGPTIIAHTPAAKSGSAPVKAGDTVDLCVSSALRLRAAKVAAVSCRRGSSTCSVLARIDPRQALPVLAAYDPARPPVAAVAERACAGASGAHQQR